MKKLIVALVLCVGLALSGMVATTGCADMNATAWRAEAEALKTQLSFTQVELAKTRKEAAEQEAEDGKVSAETLDKMKKLEDTVGALAEAIGQFSSGATAIDEGTTGGQKLAGVLQIGLGILGVVGAVFGVKERIAKTGVDRMLGAVIDGVEAAGSGVGAKEAVNRAATKAGVQPALHEVVRARTS